MLNIFIFLTLLAPKDIMQVLDNLQKSELSVIYLVFLYFADVDECATEKPCGQLCINVPGSYRCHCRTGFQLQQDGQSCRRNGMQNLKFKIKLFE